MATASTLIVGDSYMADGSTSTWPVVLSRSVHATHHNAAIPMTTSAKLVEQVQAHDFGTRSIDIVIVGSGGNDLLEDIKGAMNREGCAAICKSIEENIRKAILHCYGKGVKFFVVSDVPFTVKVPHTESLVKEYASESGLDIERAYERAIDGQHQLHQMVSGLVESFRLSHSDMKIVRFELASVLNGWVAKDNMFDAQGLHPNESGHAGLAEAVLRLWHQEHFPTGSDVGAPASASASASASVSASTPHPHQPQHHDLHGEFDRASKGLQELRGELSVADQLRFYALYKQATMGNNSTKKPSVLRHMKESEKWNAWASVKGMAQDEAKRSYVEEYETKRRRLH